MNSKNENMYTSGEYITSNPTWHVEYSSYKSKQVLDMINRNKIEIKSVCDVGCGAGGVLMTLKERLPSGIYYDGYDISPHAINLCPKGEFINFILGDITDTKDVKYDLLLALDVVEHIEDYIGFLRSLKMKSKYKIFIFPIELYVLKIIFMSKILIGRKAVGHLHYFSKETALATLVDAGYEIIDWKYSENSFKHVKLKKSRYILEFLREIPFKLHEDIAVRFFGGHSLVVLAS